MTANLTIPADVWVWQQPGAPFVAAIVEGELETGFYFGPDRFAPPAWLVALRDARCDCDTDDGLFALDDDGGGGLMEVLAQSVGRAKVDRCPRCVDGRLLHDVRVEDPDGEHDGYTECRTVRCLIDVVPVRRDLTSHGSPAVVVMCEPMVSAGQVHWVPADGSSSIPLTPAHVDALAAACGKPPADWVPGGYAVILTETP